MKKPFVEPAFKTIPKSEAKNAYDLLTEVVEIIKADPRAYDQETWVETDRDRILENADLDKKALPACGTTACVAGWVNLLKNKNPDIHSQDISKFAEKILGLNEDQANILFSGDAAVGDVPNTDHEGNWKYTSGDRIDVGFCDHAKYGISHIKNFIKIHKIQLKAHKID